MSGGAAAPSPAILALSPELCRAMPVMTWPETHAAAAATVAAEIQMPLTSSPLHSIPRAMLLR